MSLIPPGTDNKSIQELLVELKDLNKVIKESNIENKKFSIAFIALALVQVIAMLWQFFFEITISEFQWFGLFCLILLFICTYWIFRRLNL